jgi:hypothetical protein
MMVSTVVMGFPSERPPPFLQTRRTSARSRWELSKREAPQSRYGASPSTGAAGLAFWREAGDTAPCG